jgi:hypothetical protein
MAEQSIGMASGAGDGTVGGYTADRMRDMELRTFNEGLLCNNDGTQAFTMGGATTNALTIGAGNAVVNGWFYQNTTSASISVATGVPNATYSLVIVANNSAATPTVQKTVAGTAVIPAYSVRLALATAAQIGVIQAAGQYVFELSSTVLVTGGIITSFTSLIPAKFGISRNAPYQTGVSLTGGVSTVTLANTTYNIDTYSGGASTTDGIFVVNTSAGVVTVRRDGWYNITGMAVFGTGTTSWRRLTIALNGAQNTRTDQAASGLASSYMTVTQQIYCVSGDTLRLTCASGLAAQSVSLATMTITLV